MQLKLSVLTKIVKGCKTTFYFKHKESNTVLPLDILNIPPGEREDTYVRTLNAFGASIRSINIYLHLEEIYYVYLGIEHNGRIFDINTSLRNALCILEYLHDIDISIEKEILCQEGIQVTKDMLEEHLVL